MVEKQQIIDIANAAGIVFSEQCVNMLLQTNEPERHAERLINHWRKNVQQSISGGDFMKYYVDFSNNLIK